METGIAKNTLYLTLASVLQKAIAFVYFLFLARVLGPEQTGVYFLALSIILIFAVVADFGVTPVIVREVAKKPLGALDLIRTALSVKIPCILLAVLATVGTTYALNYDQQIFSLVLIALGVLVLDSISLFFYGILRGLQDLRFESMGIFLGQVLSAGAGGILLVGGAPVWAFVAVLLLGSGFNALFSMLRVAKRLGTRVLIPTFSLKQGKALIVTAIPFALAAIFVKVYSYVDTLLLGKMIGESAVGIYSIAYKFTYAFQFLPLAFVAVLYPSFSQQIENDRAQLARGFDQAMRYMILLAAPISFGLFAIAPELVSLAGEGFSESATVLRLLVFVLIPIFLDFPIGSLLNAANRQVTKTVIMGVTMVVNIALNVWWIPLFGVVGAALSALVSFWILFLIGLYFVPQMISGYRVQRLVHLVVPVLFSAACMGLVARVVSSNWHFIAAIITGGFLYVALLYLTKAISCEELKEWKGRLCPNRSY